MSSGDASTSWTPWNTKTIIDSDLYYMNLAESLALRLRHAQWTNCGLCAANVALLRQCEKEKERKGSTTQSNDDDDDDDDVKWVII